MNRRWITILIVLFWVFWIIMLAALILGTHWVR
jgi:hypothetical protein